MNWLQRVALMVGLIGVLFLLFVPPWEEVVRKPGSERTHFAGHRWAFNERRKIETYPPGTYRHSSTDINRTWLTIELVTVGLVVIIALVVLAPRDKSRDNQPKDTTNPSNDHTSQQS